MKQFLFTATATLFALSLSAQRVDIDKYSFYVEHAQMPTHYVDKADRTYSAKVTGSDQFNHEMIEGELAMRGWERVDENGTVEVRVSLSNFSRGEPTRQKKTDQKKNKEGKVISSTTNYWYEAIMMGNGSVRYYGPKNEYVSKKKSDKAAEKSKKKGKKEEAKPEENPFLAGVDIQVEDDEPKGELVRTASLEKKYKIKGNSSTSSSKARDSYWLKADGAYDDSFEDFAGGVSARVNAGMNATYGFSRKKEWLKFRILDSKKHPEYDTYQNAVKAMKAILEKKRFNKTHDEIEAALGPIIEYFEATIKKYGADDKHEKRLKSATMYNLAKLYYVLDKPEKMKEIASDYARWGHDEAYSKDFNVMADELAHLLNFHNVEGRYFVTDEDADAVEAEEGEKID